MEYHGIEMIGELILKDDITSTTPTSGSIGVDSGEVHFANGSNWIKLISENTIANYTEIPDGTKMWFYQDSAPTGWTIEEASEDALLAVGNATYSSVSGGTVQGDWSTADHDHWSNDHNHQWKDYQGSNQNYTWNAAGAQINVRSGEVNNTTGICCNVTDGNPVNSPNDYWTDIDGGGNTSEDSAGSAFRPRANVGIICRKGL